MLKVDEGVADAETALVLRVRPEVEHMYLAGLCERLRYWSKTCLSVGSCQSPRRAIEGTANLQPRRQGLTQTHYPALPSQQHLRWLRLGWQRRWPRWPCWPRWRLQGGALGSEQGDVPTCVSATQPEELMSLARTWQHRSMYAVCWSLVAKSGDLDAVARKASLLPSTLFSGAAVSMPRPQNNALKGHTGKPHCCCSIPTGSHVY